MPNAITGILSDQADNLRFEIVELEAFEEADELARAMAILDAGMHMAGERVDAGQQAQRAVALVLVVARERRMRAWPRRQVGRGVADRLNAPVLVPRVKPEGRR